jgi:hypothetical protein
VEITVRARARVYPELDVLRVGERYKARPLPSVVSEFQEHVRRTGSPHTWHRITTSPHPKGEAPVIIDKVSIPKRLRGGIETRAPCSICSVKSPKFDDGFLVFCSDGYLRIIGHECGHDHFDEDSYAAALQEHDDEVAEAGARTMLRERMPDLARALLEARTIFRDIHGVLDFQERAVAGITKRAVAAMRRSRIGDQLTVDVGSEAVDERGRRLLEQRVVSTADGLDALSPPARLLGDLNAAITEAAQVWIIERDELGQRLSAMTRHEVFAVGKAVRRLDSVLQMARDVRSNMGKLFTREGLAALSAWGRHSHCPTPFWVEVVGARVYLKVGLRPQYWDRGFFLLLPDVALRSPVEVT